METLIILAVCIGLFFVLRMVWGKILPPKKQTDGPRLKTTLKAVLFVVLCLVTVFIFGYFIWTM